MKSRRDRQDPAGRPAPARAALMAVTVALAVVTAPGCERGDDQDDAETAQEVPIAGTVAVPEERLSPFCQAMIDLGDQLLTDPPDDPDRLIIETYEGIADEVPAEIAADFEVVLADLRGEAPPTATIAEPVETTAPDGSAVDEFIVPPATSAERLNDYVEFTCRATLNNPGPPATSPEVDATDEEDGEDG